MTHPLKYPTCLFLLLAVAAAPALGAAAITITPDHPDGCYEAGEQVIWTVTGGADTDRFAYSVKAGGLTETTSGQMNFSDGHGQAKIMTMLGRPGTLLAEVTINGKREEHGGAAIDWPQIKPSAPEPPDFDAFWQEKLKELAAIPANPILEEVDSGSPGIQLCKITINNVRGTKIYGYVARPKGTTPLPAMLQLQPAGIYPLKKEWVVESAQNGWLALNIIAHDLPVDRDEAFYKEQGKGPLNHYKNQGGEDREKSYYLRMFLACARAVDYLAGRSDWNKLTLLVHGGSQGGMQALATAGLNHAVTVLTVCVPAGCDQTGSLIGRNVGFPWWLGETNAPEREARIKTCKYYDPVNFAKRIRCPSLVGVGLIDTICPPEGVLAMFNQITAPKRLVIMPLEGHSGDHPSYKAVEQSWRTAAASGKPLPLN